VITAPLLQVAAEIEIAAESDSPDDIISPHTEGEH
jgi:hypothetical protein